MSASRRLPSDTLIAAIDIGAAKASCMLARLDPDGAVTPLGVGQQTMRRGADSALVDADTAARLLAVAADEAMRMAGAPIPPVMVSVSVPGVETVVGVGVAPIAAGGVTGRTLEQAHAAAVRAASARGRRVLGVADLSAAVDEAAMAPQACLGRAGARLTLHTAVITAPDAAVAAVERCCQRAGLPIDGLGLAVTAAGEAALTQDERDGRTFVVDFGAAQTGLALFDGGRVVAARTLSRGGDVVTQALAQRVATTNAAAERVKIAHGDVSGRSEDRAVIEFAQLNADGRLSPGAAARGTVLAAIRGAWLEVLSDLGAALDQADPSGRAPLVMVGAGALTLGLAPLVERVVGRRARVGRPIGFGALDGAEGGPAYAAVCGLLAGAASAQRGGGAGVRPPAPGLGEQARRALGWLRHNL